MNLFCRPTRPIEPHEYEKVYGKKHFLFRGLSLEEQMEFWESCRTLLLSRGYHLYKPASGPCHEWMSIPTLPSFSGPVQFPYAYSEAKARADSARDPFMGVCNRSMVFYAQDCEGRHVVLKHVCGNSQEYQILRFLQSQGVQAMEENCIMPVLELIKHKENWLVVMPRWGTISYHLPLHRTEDILQYMFCLLKALTFLHANSIVHRDITPVNNLTNHIEAHPSKSAISIGDRQHLRDRGLIKYAMFDFDLSIRMPESVRLLPASHTWITVGPWPHDVAQGEYMYDPFAYDVALLGIVFCQAFQHLTQFVPMLAPLFDSMVTDDLSRRFTAAQALAFLSDNWKEFISTSQSIPYGLDEYGVHFWDKYDRWAGLPDDFVQKWGSFREPLVGHGCLSPRRPAISAMFPRCVLIQ
ncbi:other/AgaK1 protein kinase [Armillaria nabsnona]|nr:other/AgaK1 protein kinase [Armillaria nabsnona]